MANEIKCKSENNKEQDSIPYSEEYLPFFITELVPFLVEEARNNLNETEEVRQKALCKFRKLVEGEKNLYSRTDDLFLLAFLRARKFNVNKAFKVFRNTWCFRRDYDYIYKNANPTTVKKLLYRNFVGFLHYRDRKGCIVFVFKLGQWDPSKDSFEDLFLGLSAILMYAVEFPATQVAGFRLVCDLNGFSWTQMKHCHPGNLMLFFRATVSCFPGRFKGFHAVHENKLFRIAWNIMYPLLPFKLKKRIYFHGENVEALQEFIHPAVLPEEWGGQDKPYENSKWVQTVEKNTSKMLDMLKYGYRNE